MIALLIVAICVWLHSNSLINLIIYALISICGGLFMVFLMHLNFRDAKERLEEIIFDI